MRKGENVIKTSLMKIFSCLIANLLHEIYLQFFLVFLAIKKLVQRFHGEPEKEREDFLVERSADKARRNSSKKQTLI